MTIEVGKDVKFIYAGDETDEQKQRVEAKARRFNELLAANGEIEKQVRDVYNRYFQTVKPQIEAETEGYVEVGKRNSAEMEKLAKELKDEGFIIGGVLDTLPGVFVDMSGGDEPSGSAPQGSTSLQ